MLKLNKKCCITYIILNYIVIAVYYGIGLLLGLLYSPQKYIVLSATKKSKYSKIEFHFAYPLKTRLDPIDLFEAQMRF